MFYETMQIINILISVYELTRKALTATSLRDCRIIAKCIFKAAITHIEDAMIKKLHL